MTVLLTPSVELVLMHDLHDRYFRFLLTEMVAGTSFSERWNNIRWIIYCKPADAPGDLQPAVYSDVCDKETGTHSLRPDRREAYAPVYATAQSSITIVIPNAASSTSGAIHTQTSSRRPDRTRWFYKLGNAVVESKRQQCEFLNISY